MIFRPLLFVILSLIPLATLAQETTAQKDKRMKWWREARFGMFIHWGTYSVLAGEYGGRKNLGEWIREEAHIPINDYNKLTQRFNPTKFDAEKWAELAKEAGMKYVTITTKHHEGFALFDSNYTDYDVMSTPFKRDIMKELSDAVRKNGMQMCWYHSIMDWHHPDYLPRRSWETGDRPANGADMDRYCEFLHHQVSELLTKYGPIGVMWFDGEWESTWNHARGQSLYDLCRKLQPNVIVNNRVDVGRGGMGGMSDAGFAGDYGTPEQEIPATGMPGVDWETCMTMNDHWGYCRADLNFKSTKEIIRMLCDIASKGGNYLLNVGPTPEGEIPPQSVQRLKEIGAWMRVNSNAIYATTASPFQNLPWGRCTAKGETLYLHVFDWPTDGRLVVPGLGNQVVGAKLLAGNKPLQVASTDGGVVVQVPKAAPDAIASVVALQIKGAPIIYNPPAFMVDTHMFVKPMAVKVDPGSSALQVRYTTDGTAPSASSRLYSGPIMVNESMTVKARSFHNGKPVTGVVSADFQKATPWRAVTTQKLDPGLRVDIFPGDFDKMPIFEAMKPAETKTLDNFSIMDDPLREHTARLYTGFFSVSEDDVYRFLLRSDDGGKLWIDGQLVVDNDGLHSPVEKPGAAPLSKGWHHIRVEWFNKTGGADLLVKMAPLGEEPRAFSKSNLMRKSG
ncbi:MAG: alpha-L-fucosidase [Armatimonadetes bacterium]|nr:alpha-L-fucosidase [Armatimonadota bacterium]